MRLKIRSNSNRKLGKIMRVISFMQNEVMDYLSGSVSYRNQPTCNKTFYSISKHINAPSFINLDYALNDYYNKHNMTVSALKRKIIGFNYENPKKFSLESSLDKVTPLLEDISRFNIFNNNGVALGWLGCSIKRMHTKDYDSIKWRVDVDD